MSDDWIPPPPPVFDARRSALRRAALLALLFVAGAAAGSGVAAGVLLGRHVSTPAATVLPPAISPPGALFTPPAGSGDQGGGAAPPPSNGGGGVAGTASSVAAKVDPTVVDINGALAGGGEVAGTGVVISSNGYVLTNNHVIEGTTQLTAQIDGAGPSYTATVVGTDASDDIAVVRINGVSNLQTATLGDSSSLRVGDAVVAIGNALGQGGTPSASQGSVTALDQTITAGDSTASTETLNGTIQIDAFIQPGDSGGPLSDMSGDVVGIDTAAQSSGRLANSGSNTGFAIPINTAMTIARQIESGHSSSTVQIGTRGILGVSVANDQSASGALVNRVESGSPAENAGIAAGDVITSIDGRSVSSASTLQAALTGRHPGDTVSVGWTDANGASHTATLQLEAGPPA
ncbi:MAG: trypsin-like peptidase domain-containing protein [Candidatus Dormibacteraeota bacterium]|nr:trypsin-like peptidase domain-containing protein [Candidatus Dormibacteraeota bacterium]